MTLFKRLVHPLTLSLSGAVLLAAPVIASADDFPECKTPLGTLRVAESEENGRWWEEASLPEPTRLIKVFVQQSRCFRLVDRGIGMDVARAERELAASGELQAGSNVGLGQTLAADYVLVPDVIMSNENAAGGGFGMQASKDAGGFFGRGKSKDDISAGMNFQTKRAHVVLTAVDVRTSELLGTVDAVASKSDKRFSFGGSFGRMLSLNAGGYVNTEMGQVVAMAYAQAYTALIEQIQEDRKTAGSGRKQRSGWGKGAQWALALATGGAVPPPMPAALQRKLDERRGVVPDVVEQLSAAAAAPTAQPVVANVAQAVQPLQQAQQIAQQAEQVQQLTQPLQQLAQVAAASAPQAMLPTTSKASASAPVQALVVTRVGRLLSDAQGSASVRMLDPGMLLYPTGAKQGLLIEVDDELGNRGWVNSQFVELAR